MIFMKAFTKFVKFNVLGHWVKVSDLSHAEQMGGWLKSILYIKLLYILYSFWFKLLKSQASKSVIHHLNVIFSSILSMKQNKKNVFDYIHAFTKL